MMGRQKKAGIFVLIFFLIILFSIPVLSLEEDEMAQQIKNKLELINKLIEQTKSIELEKYNKVVASVHDESGNPVDCTMRTYYDNAIQEKFSTSKGKFEGVFDHGKTIPAKVISFALTDCPCLPISAKIDGPKFLEINDELEKLKKFLEEQAKKLGEEKVKKAIEGAIKGAGLTTSASGILAFADYYAKMTETILREIGELQQKLSEVNRKLTEEEGVYRPLYPGVNLKKEKWLDWLARILGQKSYHDPQTEFDYDIIVKCDKNIPLEQKEIPFVPIDELLSQPPKVSIPPTTTLPTPTPSTATRTPIPSIIVHTPTPAPTQTVIIGSTNKKNCPECDEYKLKITQLTQELKNYYQEYELKMKYAEQTENEIEKAQRILNDANNVLARFDNPRSYISSGDKKVTQTDLEIERQVLHNALQKYKSGELNAQELLDHWNSLSREELDKFKEETRQNLMKKIDDAKNELARLESRKASFDEQVKELQENIKEILAELERLDKKYADCINTCKKTDWTPAKTPKMVESYTADVSVQTLCDNKVIISGTISKGDLLKINKVQIFIGQAGKSQVGLSTSGVQFFSSEEKLQSGKYSYSIYVTTKDGGLLTASKGDFFVQTTPCKDVATTPKPTTTPSTNIVPRETPTPSYTLTPTLTPSPTPSTIVTPTPVSDTCTDYSKYGFPVTNSNNLPNSCRPTDDRPGWDCYTFQEAQCNPSLRCFCITPPEQLVG